MDFLTIAGILVALGAILGGNILEGGHTSSLMQLTAGIIVGGGTMGTVLVSFPLADFLRGLKLGKLAFLEPKHDMAGLVKVILELAGLARRDGVLALESRIGSIDDAFLKRAVQFVVDGVDPAVTRDALEAEIHAEAEEQTMGAKVFEAAGGYSPTIGIIGAVLGLIHVMNNLSDPSKLGPGIAVAFVATVYGVAMANILFLPMANKIKRKIALEKERKTIVAEGVLGIQEGLNPRVLEEKLRSYMGGHIHGEAPAAPAGK